MSAIGALLGIVALSACAADQEPPDDPCQKLTGAERAECEHPKAPRPAADEDPPPPDTKSEGNDQSDTADPPPG